MNIAIHHREGSFSGEWVKYCIEQGIPYKIVNAYSSDIIEQLRDCDGFLWHHHHGKYQDVLFAKQLLTSLEVAGKKVFPNFHTAWHFDDKVGQKYLLESVGAPLVPSHVFYDRESAIAWAKNTEYPKVFKLRGGAGATNVKLIHNVSEAMRVIRRSFGRGFYSYNRWASLKDSLRGFFETKNLFPLLRSFLKLLILPKNVKMVGKQRGYVYFQDFIPDNDCDIRLIVIGGKFIYGMKRINRENDFRASGSSEFNYEDIPKSAVELALETAQKLKVQSAAFDIIYADDNPLIIELSYGFGTKGSSHCPGYWDENLDWHEGQFNPFGWIIEGVVSHHKG